MNVFRLTAIGILLTGLLTYYVGDIPIVWAACVFGILCIVTRKFRTATLILISSFTILGISEIYEFSSRNSLLLDRGGVLVLMHRPYIILFAFFFIPMMFPISSLNLYDILPTQSSRRPKIFNRVSHFFVQIAHRKEALQRREKEIHEALSLHGIDTSGLVRRVRYVSYWLPILASTAFVEALESTDYLRMLKIDIGRYRGLYRHRNARGLVETSLNFIILVLLGAMLYAFCSR